MAPNSPDIEELAASMINRTLPALFAAMIALSGCSLEPSCDVEAYDEAIQPLLQEWNDMVEIADLTPRESLLVVIYDLEYIKGRAWLLEVDECLEDTHAYLLSYMETTIGGFLMYEGEVDDDVVSSRFAFAEILFKTYLLNLGQIKEGD